MRGPKTGKGKLIKNVTYADWRKEYETVKKVWNNGEITQMLSKKPVARISELTAAQLKGMIVQVKRSRPDVPDDIYHGAYRQNMLDCAHQLGYDVKPTIINWKDSLLIPDGAKIYHYTDRKYQLLRGPLEYSTKFQSRNGRGIYFGKDFGKTAEKYATENNELVTAVIKSDAVIINQLDFMSELLEQMRTLGIKQYPVPRDGINFFDYIAMQLGVHGWYNPQMRKVIIINRGKLGILDEDK
ncbi:hypothetical protein D1831_13075 [Lactiplantibacillus garii]|uniref:Uncharacterized protein n=1 Tax=Lactiplantibacillus garii TaxID=2306423 RepID=A0A3R8J5A1_9LACO|nr:hypothetical protein [Lactiplantibacillus garii]RRK09382.1 hypothetical protein D1831_13075 [Lactiplantibacillus garii]